jgi:hypothetical protein
MANKRIEALKNFRTQNKIRLFAIPQKTNDLVAQLVEQLTLNQWVESSSLSQVT